MIRAKINHVVGTTTPGSKSYCNVVGHVTLYMTLMNYIMNMSKLLHYVTMNMFHLNISKSDLK